MAEQHFGAGMLLDELAPSAATADRETARFAAALLRRLGNQPEVVVRTKVGESVALPHVFVRLVASMLEAVAEGHAVAVLREANEVSTSAAAEFLGVSRPHVVKLIDSGLLPGRMAGSHRRVRMTDLLAYKQTVDRRHAFLDELIAESEEMGLYDPPHAHHER